MRPFLISLCGLLAWVPLPLRAADSQADVQEQIRQIRAEIAELQMQVDAARAQLARAQQELTAAENAVNADPANAQRLREWRYERVQLETERLNLSREKLRLEDARLALIKPKYEPAPQPPPAPLRPEYQTLPSNQVYRLTPYSPSYIITDTYPIFTSWPYYHTPYYRSPAGYVSTPSTPTVPLNSGYYPIYPTQSQGASYYLNYHSGNFDFRLNSPNTQSNPSPYHLGPTGRQR